MKRIYTLLAILFLSQQLEAQIDRGKTLHFVGGGLFALAGAGIAKKASKGDRWWTFAGAVAGSAVIAVGKEAVDVNSSEFGWSNSDIAYTVFGGVVTGVIIDLSTDHDNKRQQKRLQKLREQNQTAELSEKEKWIALMELDVSKVSSESSE